jgi:hypothetical protein
MRDFDGLAWAGLKLAAARTSKPTDRANPIAIK